MDQTVVDGRQYAVLYAVLYAVRCDEHEIYIHSNYIAMYTNEKRFCIHDRCILKIISFKSEICVLCSDEL